jgi:hypothetical protein
MQPLDAFLPQLNPWVMGCPTPMAHQALVRSAAVFCDETNVVRTLVGPIALTAGEATYDLDLPMGLRATRVLGAWLGDKPLTVQPGDKHLANLSYFSSVADGSTARGEPTHVRVLSESTVTLIPAPSESTTADLTVLVATSPTQSAKQLEDALLSRWSEGVVAGAIEILTAIPGQPFTDMAQSVAASVRFWRSVNRARIESRRGDTSAPMRVRNNPLV